ncbi:hypothetical protein H4O18_11770 [Arenibacter sp. BSSL-BM3]|uniref:Uncharacterized protein n=1 Tax=Arenibacter arenosicollis TaxID=2762274 RepID=A0ABR7QN97_9FLAO|nr:hypothetical protein [Arenibacter arenosicollis]MBC8768672.1 hypothetical protein [Arenibacter arenosicollis]
MDKENQVAQLHWKVQQWKLHFQLMDDEIVFINQLLNSNAFKPNVPNLFEHLMDYKTRLEKINSRSETIRTQISTHENNLGGISDKSESSSGLNINKKNDQIQVEVDACLGDFQNLKSEIFNYTGGILLNNNSERK